uniref:unspecific monooxygenase n=1 Tax=Papilio polyxenes TaxID=7146 RepID=Q2HY58_PAPPO|nr:CYP6B3v3a variant [Papilio polyxenes]ABC96863.1 CYP6B3v3b variant [Papilio polyxenes]ABC96864.1 CYP6B3v3c variant [Papilio polyxenes]
MLYVITLVTVLAGLLHYYFTRNFDYWKKRNVAGPKPIPFFGNLKDSVLRRKHQVMVYKSIYDEFPNEKVVGIYRMTTPSVLIRDLDIIKHVLIKDFESFADRGVEFSIDGLGANIFHADGDRWRSLRNRFTPLFTSGKLKTMLPLMSQVGDKFIKYIDEVSQTKSEQSIHDLVQIFTITNIAACAFGLNLDENMLKTLQDLDKYIFTVNYSGEFDMLYPGILKKFNGSIFPKVVKQFFDKLTKDIFEMRKGTSSCQKDMIDSIQELRQQKTVDLWRKHDNEDVKPLELIDGVISAQMFIFYAAGYETSATTMTYLFYELAKNPDIQDKLIAEIDEVLSRHDGNITYECLSEMTYLSKVFDETLRKYPVGDFTQRNAKTDYVFPGTDITIKKGQTVIISTWSIQNDPKYYPNPEKFDPERFNPENIKNRHPCAYLPFSAGPRNCLGLRFAKWQIEVCVVKVLSKYRVEPSNKSSGEFKFDPMRLFVLPKGGIFVNIVRR